jgi:hypothetical protein
MVDGVGAVCGARRGWVHNCSYHPSSPRRGLTSIVTSAADGSAASIGRNSFLHHLLVLFGLRGAIAQMEVALVVSDYPCHDWPSCCQNHHFSYRDFTLSCSPGPPGQQP